MGGGLEKTFKCRTKINEPEYFCIYANRFKIKAVNNVGTQHYIVIESSDTTSNSGCITCTRAIDGLPTGAGKIVSIDLNGNGIDPVANCVYNVTDTGIIGTMVYSEPLNNAGRELLEDKSNVLTLLLSNNHTLTLMYD